MRSWPRPVLPRLPGTGDVPQVHDTATGALAPSARPAASAATLYVCGITPYDATHLGHAATYIAFDLLVRAWRDAGLVVTYAQCVTDVDDPLLERAEATGEDWRDLAAREIDVYRTDMRALAVIPPDHLVGVTEVIAPVAQAVAALEAKGLAYRIPAPDGGADVYADLARDPGFGSVGGLDQRTMAALFSERGGDPDRPGKRGALDPLLWRARRVGEPWWDSPLGPGRPGWHIECAVIAARDLGVPFDVQGGGADLVFPHHEMSTSHLRALTDEVRPAIVHTHSGLIGLDGAKMSKSRGNLVLVSRLVAAGAAPAAIRLALLAGHYREDRDWTPALLAAATRRLAAWRAALAPNPAANAKRPEAAPAEDERLAAGPWAAAELSTLADMRQALASDLDSPAALAAVDRFVAARPAASPPGAPLVHAAVEALLGVALT